MYGTTQKSYPLYQNTLQDMLQLTPIKSRNHKRHIWTSNLNPCHVLQKSQRTYCKNCALQTSQLEKISKIRQIHPSRCKIHQILNESTMRMNNLIWIFQLWIIALLTGKPLKTLRLVVRDTSLHPLILSGKTTLQNPSLPSGKLNFENPELQWFGRRPTPLLLGETRNSNTKKKNRGNQP